MWFHACWVVGYEFFSFMWCLEPHSKRNVPKGEILKQLWIKRAKKSFNWEITSPKRSEGTVHEALDVQWRVTTSHGHVHEDFKRLSSWDPLHEPLYDLWYSSCLVVVPMKGGRTHLKVIPFSRTWRRVVKVEITREVSLKVVKHSRCLSKPLVKGQWLPKRLGHSETTREALHLAVHDSCKLGTAWSFPNLFILILCCFTHM